MMMENPNCALLSFCSSSPLRRAALAALCRLFLKSYYWSRALCATGNNSAAEHIKSARENVVVGVEKRDLIRLWWVPKEEEEEEEEGKKSSLDFQSSFSC